MPRNIASEILEGLQEATDYLGNRGKTPGKEEDRQISCTYGTLLKSNFGFAEST